jgi:hypothetical protein
LDRFEDYSLLQVLWGGLLIDVDGVDLIIKGLRRHELKLCLNGGRREVSTAPAAPKFQKITTVGNN